MRRFVRKHTDETEEEIRARRALRAEQMKQRLEQKEHHLQIQEKKIQMLKEKRAKEEAEKKAKQLKKIFSLYYVKKTAKGLAYLAGTAASLILVLRTLAIYNMDAREYYFILMNRLNTAVSMAIRGSAEAGRKLSETIDSIISFLRRGRVNLAHSDCKRVKTDSICKLYNRSMRHFDRQYRDLIAPLVAGITFKTTILPILTAALKAGVAAGIAGGISQGIIGPIINRIKSYGFALLTGKAAGAFSESIIQKIKNDMSILINVFRTKDPAVAQKLMSGLTKFNAAT